VSVRWEGTVEARSSGEHQFQLFSNGGIRMWVDDRLVADHWRQAGCRGSTSRGCGSSRAGVTG